MKIKQKSYKPFGELSPGDVFRHSDINAAMKIEKLSTFTAVDLEDGIPYEFDDKTMVFPIECSLSI